MATFGENLTQFLDIIHDLLENAVDALAFSMRTSFNAILDVQEMDCEGNWVLYVKTAITATGGALWLLITPSGEEILESYLQPKTGRFGGRRGRPGGRHNRPLPGRGRRISFAGGIPDLDNAIADTVPGRTWFKGLPVGPGDWLFWTGVQVADRVLWHWLVIKATETFATEWQSALIESGECQSNPDGFVKVETGPRSSFNQSPMWFDGGAQPISIGRNMQVGNNGRPSIDPPNNRADGWVICTGTFELESDNTPGLTQIDAGIVIIADTDDGTDQVIIADVSNIKIGPNQVKSETTSGFSHMAGAHNFRCIAVYNKITVGTQVTVNGQFQLTIQAQKLYHV
jgi:hypothetical protein